LKHLESGAPRTSRFKEEAFEEPAALAETTNAAAAWAVEQREEFRRGSKDSKVDDFGFPLLGTEWGPRSIAFSLPYKWLNYGYKPTYNWGRHPV
jgi:hypothetical protein